MKKVVLLISFFVYTIAANAVWTRSVGSNAEFSVYYFENEYYLILSFKDDDGNRLTDNTIIKFMLNDGQVLRLEGNEGSKQTKIRSINWGFGIISGGSSDKHFAIVYITKEQIEKLKIGVDKVVINTIPEAYLRDEWRGKKEFGIELYNDFKNLKGDFGEELHNFE